MHWTRMRYCLSDRSGHYRGSRTEALHAGRLGDTMDQVIDERDECVLSTDQLTLMRLRLLQAKYFPPLIFSYDSRLPLFSVLSLSSVSPPQFGDGKVLLKQ